MQRHESESNGLELLASIALGRAKRKIQIDDNEGYPWREVFYTLVAYIPSQLYAPESALDTPTMREVILGF
jgi:hypothetical protein